MKNLAQTRNTLFVFIIFALSFCTTLPMEQKIGELTKSYEECVKRCGDIYATKSDRHARRDCITVCSTVYKAHMKLIGKEKTKLDVTLNAGSGIHWVKKY